MKTFPSIHLFSFLSASLPWWLSLPFSVVWARQTSHIHLFSVPRPATRLFNHRKDRHDACSERRVEERISTVYVYIVKSLGRHMCCWYRSPLSSCDLQCCCWCLSHYFTDNTNGGVFFSPAPLLLHHHREINNFISYIFPSFQFAHFWINKLVYFESDNI